MRKSYLFSCVYVVVAVSVTAVFNYAFILHDLVERSKTTVVALLPEMKADLQGAAAEAGNREITLERLHRVAFDHLRLPGAFAAILATGEDGRTVLRESSGLGEKGRLLSSNTPLTPARNTLETDDYLLFLVDSQPARQVVVGLEKQPIAAEAQRIAVSTAVVAYVLMTLFLVAWIALLKLKVEQPLQRFMRDGLRQSLQNAMHGLPGATAPVPPLPVWGSDASNPLNQTLKMISSWGQHKADVDQLIRVATMETDKRELAANTLRIASRSLPFQGLAFYEVNHSLNRLEPVYLQTAMKPHDDLLDTPSACLVYRTGSSLLQPADSPLCTACWSGDRSLAHLCKTLMAGGGQVGICRFEVDPKGLANWLDYLPDQQSRLALLDSMLEPFVHLLGLAVSHMSVVETYKNSAITDALTGVYNRRYLLEYFTNILNLAKRKDNQLSVFMVDVDHFKRLNDEFGHKVGDIVLQAIAHTMSHSLRESDTLGRYGGEEFVVILPDTDSQTATGVAEKMRCTVESIDWDAYGLPTVPRITISIGVAEFPLHGYSHYHLVNAADKALYQAKRSGRNRVAVHSHLPESEGEPAAR